MIFIFSAYGALSRLSRTNIGVKEQIFQGGHRHKGAVFRKDMDERSRFSRTDICVGVKAIGSGQNLEMCSPYSLRKKTLCEVLNHWNSISFFIGCTVDILAENAQQFVHLNHMCRV
jgi:hypothetical protein